MNRIILGCLFGVLVVSSMMVLAQTKEAPAPKRIGSDAFFGQKPETIRQKITEPPPPPKPQPAAMQKSDNNKSKNKVTTLKKESLKSAEEVPLMPENNLPPNQNTDVNPNTGIKTNGNGSLPPREPKPTDDYIRGY